MKFLALDADGVLLDYVKGFMSFCKNSGDAIHCQPEEIDTWDMRRPFGVSIDDPSMDKHIAQRILEFSFSEEFKHIPYIDGALEAIKEIKNANPHLQIIAITSAGREDRVISSRKFNLREFPFDEINVLPLGGNKRDLLATLPEGSVFVDDLPSHIEAGESVGVKSVLFRQPYNAKHEHHTVINNWLEGKECIQEILNKNRCELVY